MIVAFSCNVMKCLWWILGLGLLDFTMNESHWMTEGMAANLSLFHKLCVKNHSKHVYVCSLPSSKYFRNTVKYKRMLVFRISNTDIRVLFSSHQINLPNASVSYRAGSNFEIPLYREDISKSLHVFYEGKLVVSGLFLPFSAEWNGVQFTGRTYFPTFFFKLTCRVSESIFYMKDHCLHCTITCSNTELIQKHSHTFPDHTDFLETDDEYPGIYYSQILSVKSQLYRKHRSADVFAPVPLSCVLHLVADHLFFKYMADGSVVNAINVMFSIVNGADAIFRSTDFDGDNRGDNIGFLIGKVTVFSDIRDHSYILTHSYLTAADYLKIFSHYDFDDYCLGLAFTYREFDGLGGSAFQAHSDESLPGGICQKRLKHNLHMVSYNTVVTTFLSYGKTLKLSRVVLILAHEMGHAFGARHDNTTDCLPGGKSGQFLMSAKIKSGKLPNNPRFSVCSIRAMLPVIKKKGSCLVSNNQISQCGNTVPEIGEECDCGTSNICHAIDPCCTPADVEENEDTPCTVRRSRAKLCSPKVHPCCSESCTYVSSNVRKVCNELYDCSSLSFCDGLSSHCPFMGHLPNGTLCNHGFQVCNGGKCSEGVCKYYNLTNCVCTELGSQCKLCCKDPQTSACRPASSFGIPNIHVEIHHEPGEQCHANAFCDLSLECKEKDTSAVSENEDLGFRIINDLIRNVKNYWLCYIFIGYWIVFSAVVLLLPYRFTDSNHIKALRYGKMMAVFATGQYQTKIYRQTLTDIDEHYTILILRLRNGYEQMDFIEAMGRLKLFFPEVHMRYLSRIAKLSASESTAVKILLLQGFKIRTFTKATATSQ
ncbi:unnamed protein product [Candidula unifasciata]|uniref:Disintegrin and metalloproteinase domain-containing protein 10 n=1 Tax=Candidula unifasciata TaxID=100452 RepID=A0A8S4A4C6_9EUPU|nr:unnamed protein product [Candidula unifasciata]